MNIPKSLVFTHLAINTVLLAGLGFTTVQTSNQSRHIATLSEGQAQLEEEDDYIRREFDEALSQATDDTFEQVADVAIATARQTIRTEVRIESFHPDTRRLIGAIALREHRDACRVCGAYQRFIVRDSLYLDEQKFRELLFIEP